MAGNAQLDSDLVAALLKPPRFQPGEVPQSDEWSEKRYESDYSLSGKTAEAAFYLKQISVPVPKGGWVITHTLYKAIKYNPELIVIAARMKKLMTN